MKLAYFDPFSGASGDMILGAIVDAGLPVKALREEMGKLPLAGYSLAAQKTQRGGIAATKVNVKLKGHPHDDHPNRHLPDILRAIERSDLPDDDKRQASAVFQRLAEAEGRVHGCPPEKIHFHEVGAVDAIVDIVGSVVGLRLLGVERVVCGPVRTGMGFVTCAHGRLPVPAPAAAELLKGFPTVGTEVEGELTTPTGAALLTTLCDAFGPRPLMTVTAVGYGAGAATRETPPNVLRLFVGEVATEAEAEETDEVLVVEANLDDITGEIIGYVLERLFAAGALDAFLIPIHMKKNRPGVILQAIVEPGNAPAIEQIILTETSTFGIRRTRASRRKLRRESVEVETRYGKIRVKVGHMGKTLVHAAPEYEDCRRAAAEAAVPLKHVYDAALDAFRRR
ncbi:MAG TPA: nickel pincer cofactor biosynthesis protein LarC [Planctomycetota bacterium]|nr:nickel pincer cofactor biosynthesis protein LarC [Planctomycetota bacterium]